MIAKRRHAELAGQAAKFVAELLLIEPLSPAFDHKLEAVEALGRDAIAALGARHAGSLAHVAPPPTEGITHAIAALRSLAHSLEPMKDGNLAAAPARRGFGLFSAPQRGPEAYFARYSEAQTRIEGALSRLTRERDGLLRANTALATERASLAAPLAALAELAVLTEEIALNLAARAEALAARDPLRARRLQADALHVVRGRQRDIAETRVLVEQAIMARDIIAETNARLASGIEQAIAVMLLVLRTAMAAARAIAQQDLVLDKIASLNRAASNLIREDDPVASDGSAGALQTAFVQLYDALDRLDGERAAITALPPRSNPV